MRHASIRRAQVRHLVSSLPNSSHVSLAEHQNGLGSLCIPRVVNQGFQVAISKLVWSNFLKSNPQYLGLVLLML
jgi:hypothetical protein